MITLLQYSWTGATRNREIPERRAHREAWEDNTNAEISYIFLMIMEYSSIIDPKDSDS